VAVELVDADDVLVAHRLVADLHVESGREGLHRLDDERGRGDDERVRALVHGHHASHAELHDGAGHVLGPGVGEGHDLQLELRLHLRGVVRLGGGGPQRDEQGDENDHDAGNGVHVLAPRSSMSIASGSAAPSSAGSRGVTLL
jgi:hypothetical protein